ncbi:MAG: PIN domain-containing protein [Burkholderiales bacterium]|nr:PIN domain-containing protein [Burkholderiales bacterium]
MTPDVNVLIAAFRQEHAHHAKARAWLLDACTQTAVAGTALRLMPVVMTSFLRLVTNPKVFAVPATTQQAIAFLDAVLVNPGVAILDAPAPWPVLRKMCLEKNLSANALPDAMIAATVLQCKEVLTSFDRDFLRLLPKHQLQLLVN